MASPPPRRPSSAARYLVVFVVGVFAGVMCAVMLLRALQARQDPFPDALMQVMAHQTAALKASATANRCAATDAIPRLQSLRAMANDLEGAFPGLREEDGFVAAAGALRGTLDSALSAPPSDCAQVGVVLERIGEDCRTCHQQFR